MKSRRSQLQAVPPNQETPVMTTDREPTTAIAVYVDASGDAAQIGATVRVYGIVQGIRALVASATLTGAGGQNIVNAKCGVEQWEVTYETATSPTGFVNFGVLAFGREPASSGGGTGTGVPVPPGAGYAFVSTGAAAGDFDWELRAIPTPPAAGLALTSYGTTEGDFAWGSFSISSLSGAQTIEVGDVAHASIVNPAFAATYSSLPDSANMTNDGGVDTPHVIASPFAAWALAIPGPGLPPLANGSAYHFTLHATKNGQTVPATVAKTYANPIVWGVVASGTAVATQGFIDSLKAQIKQLHTANGGTYATNAGVGEYNAFATPYGPPTIFDGSFFVAPTFIGTMAAWDNARGVTISMNVYTVGAVAVGATNWTLS